MIDLRSDTVTQPTVEMRRAMMEAEVGDDVFGDDPTVIRLEALAAAAMGKEAALYLPTGTMANEVGIMSWTHPGEELIADIKAHVIYHELGGPARLSGLSYALSTNPDSLVRPEDVRRLVRPADPYSPRTSLLCLENALGNGAAVPVPELMAAAEAAWALGMAVHMDGARIYNAALALGKPVAEIAACGDSVMFCLSKGLCAPAGSMLCGPRDFIGRARTNRKLLGGGMRQTGILAAAGIIALTKMTDRLGEDHENARYLGGLLAELPGISVARERIQINMVFWRSAAPFDPDAFTSFMLERGIKTAEPDDREYRFVTHHGIGRPEIDRVAAAMEEFFHPHPHGGPQWAQSD
jgi:threonine aldolase